MHHGLFFQVSDYVYTEVFQSWEDVENAPRKSSTLMYIGELEPSHLRKDSTNKFRIMSTPNGG